MIQLTIRQTDLQNRRRKHRRDAHRRLLDAAHGLLEEHPWAEISLDDITSAAQIARTAFYRHFQDRQHLLMAMLEDVDLELDHVAENWMAPSEDPIAELGRSLTTLTQTFVDHGRLIQAISDAARQDPEIGGLYQRLADREAAKTAAHIQAEVEAGRSHIADPGEVARALTWMNERYLLACFGQRPFTDAATVTAALTTVWINTLYGPLAANSPHAGATDGSSPPVQTTATRAPSQPAPWSGTGQVEAPSSGLPA